MKSASTPLFCIALVGALACPAAHAGRPLVTEDAFVLERADCELEASTAHELTGDDKASWVGSQITCGIGWHTQLALRADDAKFGAMNDRRFGLGGKTELWQQEARGALALAWLLALDHQTPEGWRHDSTEVRLVYSGPVLEATTLHAAFGHGRDELGHSARTMWGLALEHDPIGSLAPMGELFGDDHEAPSWNLGLRWTVLPERFFVDGSYGQQFNTDAPAVWSLGLKLAF